MLTFDPIEHRYFWDGEPVPNTTRILAGLVSYDHIPRDVLERAQQEGNAIHRMIELDCMDDLDIGALPDWMGARYDAWCKFKDDTGFECLASERQLFHPSQRYAGTADLFGLMPKLKGVKGPTNIDVKRSFFAGAAISLQLSSYTDAWNNTSSKEFRVPETNRFALRLDADGKYRLLRFEDRNDFAVWTAQLITYRWKEQHHGK
ncbi:MAG: hypothetical protein HYX63_01410 [Gammaproteobacteria bacterium]|nr:hypothetical protein [Gammaproteobacteria bacterium]